LLVVLLMVVDSLWLFLVGSDGLTDGYALVVTAQFNTSLLLQILIVSLLHLFVQKMIIT